MSFGGRTPLGPAGGAYSALPDPLAALKLHSPSALDPRRLRCLASRLGRSETERSGSFFQFEHWNWVMGMRCKWEYVTILGMWIGRHRNRLQCIGVGRTGNQKTPFPIISISHQWRKCRRRLAQRDYSDSNSWENVSELQTNDVNQYYWFCRT